MLIQQLRSLICPYCQTPFYIHIKGIVHHDAIVYGTVYCQCDEFPIIEGILYLHREKSKQIVSFIKEKNYKFALLYAIDELAWLRKRISPNLLHILYPFIHPKKTSIYLWHYLFRRTTEEYNYYFNRSREKDSLLAFLPLTTRSRQSHTTWVNIGSGMHNWYKEIQKEYPKMHSINLESNFLVMYLGTIFYPNIQSVWICTDASIGLCVRPRTVHIVTCLDTIPFIKNQRHLIELVTKTHVLAKNGIVFCSAIPEHMYFSIWQHQEVFPISKTLIQTYFPSPCIFFDHKILTTIVQTNRGYFKQAVITPKQPIPRYDLLWPNRALQEMRLPDISSSIRKRSYQFWQEEKPLWENHAF